MQKHITFVGVLHIVLSAWGILLAFIVFGILTYIGGSLVGGDQTAQAILTTVGCVVPGLLFVLSVPGIIGGIGVLRRKSWGRYLTLVLSVLDLINIPLGTAVGIYSIWVLMQEETAQLFAEGSGP